MKLKLLLCAALMLPFASRADDIKSTRDSLKNITAVHVAIGNIADAPEGLTREILQTDMELSLRKVRIPVAESGSPLVYVELDTTKEGALYVQVTLFQQVQIARDPKGVYLAATWSQGFVGISHDSRYGRDVALQCLEKFENAYLAVNPK